MPASLEAKAGGFKASLSQNKKTGTVAQVEHPPPPKWFLGWSVAQCVLSMFVALGLIPSIRKGGKLFLTLGWDLLKYANS